MNTLNRRITGTILGSAENYAALRVRWSQLINSPKHGHPWAHSGAHHLLYMALMGRDWRKAFTPITNVNKRYNGGTATWGLKLALQTIHSSYQADNLLAPFEGIVTPEMLMQIRALITTTRDVPVGAATSSEYSFPAYDATAVARMTDLAIVSPPVVDLPLSSTVFAYAA